jgi:hypothetical protein
MLEGYPHTYEIFTMVDAPDERTGNDAQICSRLSKDDTLVIPTHMLRDRLYPSQQELEGYLQSLLRRDPAVFLERYGKQLTSAELALFEQLCSDYEVKHWYEDAEKALTPAPQAAPGLPTASKNRRLAYMLRLEKEGEYFSEENMRTRAPLIWHEYIGQHEGEAAPVQPSEGEQLHDTLLRAHDELRVRTQLEEQLAEQECQISEEEEDDDDKAEDVGKPNTSPRETAAAPAVTGSRDTAASAHVCSSGTVSTSAAAAPSNRDQFGSREQRRADLLDEMQRRFLDGVDSEHVNYAAIDEDAQLDEDWAAQQEQDAHDAYFDAD